MKNRKDDDAHNVLIRDLVTYSAPAWIIAQARNYIYHDAKTFLALPKVALVQDIMSGFRYQSNWYHRDLLIENVKKGKYDNPVTFEDISEIITDFLSND